MLRPWPDGQERLIKLGKAIEELQTMVSLATFSRWLPDDGETEEAHEWGWGSMEAAGDRETGDGTAHGQG